MLGEYFILQIILNKQLHTTDDEVQEYAINLMDKLEAFKTANSTNDAVIDDLAAKAYIENFALETFGRADDAQRGSKVNRQTADTFQAAATFLDLLSIWGPLEGEAAAKSKFAKFHALRIAKALKAGEDPNATNPVVEEPPKAEDGEDGIEAELRNTEGAGQAAYRPPTVESVQTSRPESTVQGGPSIPPPVLPTSNLNEPADPNTGREISPIDPPESAATRTGSVGGGYFPSVPGESNAPTASDPDLSIPAAPSALDEDGITANETHIAPPPSDPSNFYTTAPPSEDPATALPPSAPAMQAPAPQPPFVPQPPTPQAAPITRAPPVPLPSGPPPGGYRDDDESVAAAQKHARWAISALNFEDVPTAVRELRGALEKLGAL